MNCMLLYKWYKWEVNNNKNVHIYIFIYLFILPVFQSPKVALLAIRHGTLKCTQSGKMETLGSETPGKVCLRIYLESQALVWDYTQHFVIWRENISGFCDELKDH